MVGVLGAEMAALVNGAAVIVGSAAGALGRRGLSESMRAVVLQGLSLAVIAIGLEMTFGSAPLDPLLLVASMVLGAIAGEALGIEERLDHAAGRLRRAVGQGSGFVEGLVLATLIFCVGPIAVVGALESGLRGEGALLFAKSLLDGVTSVFLAASFGWGVIGAAAPVLIYEGGIALGARLLAPLLSTPVVDGLTASGGLLVVGIGVNMLLGAKLKIGNMLPALVFGAILAGLKAHYGLPI